MSTPIERNGAGTTECGVRSAECGTPRQSQCDRILAKLEECQGGWVSALELHQLSGSLAVHSRINDLRARGNVIQHRNEWHDGQCHSFYRLHPDYGLRNAECGVRNADASTPQQAEPQPELQHLHD